MSFQNLFRVARLHSSRSFSQATRSFQPTTSNFFQPSHNVGRGLHKLPRGSIGVRNYYSMPHMSPYEGMNMKILYGVIGVNAGVFVYFKYLQQQVQQGASPENLVSFVKNMTLNLNYFKDDKRYWTAITSVFTHFDPMHLLGNLMSFYFMGQMVAAAPIFTTARFVTLIIGSGLTGSLGYLYTRFEAAQAAKAQYGGVIDNRRALGFSGSVMGVGAVAACMFPKERLLIWGIVPMPLWALMGGYFVYDTFFLRSTTSGTAHAGHLGGLGFGLVYYFLYMRGMMRGRIMR